MGRGITARAFSGFVALFGALLVAFLTQPLSARESSRCDLEAPVEAALADALDGWRDWQCADGSRTLDQGRSLVRFELAADGSGAAPRHLISRAAKFDSLTVASIGSGGTNLATHRFDDIKATFFDRQFIVDIPSFKGTPEAVLVAVDSPTQPSILDYLRLTDAPPGLSEQDRNHLLLITLFVGMMLMPLIFDFVFFQVLRESFILWHAALVASLALQLTCTNGLYLALFDAQLPLIRILTIGSFNIMVVAGMMFSVTFIEPSKLSAGLRRAVKYALAVFTTISCVHMAGIEALGRVPANIYYLSGAPLALLALAVIALGIRARSRAAWYLLIGLGPLILVAVIRVVSFALPNVPTVDANDLLMVATMIEVVATAMGVSSRFLSLKLDRDRARAEMDVLEELAERDALTGLLNRRAIDARFEELHRVGYETFALIDLDHFKPVNDTAGHMVGDEVLKVVARVLQSDPESIALRLGGEEFLLAMRGKHATARAEKLRNTIPIRVAQEVPELEQLVTASMGLLVAPRRAVPMANFSDIYSRVDMLLYEAKAQGRNRTVSERLQAFEHHVAVDRRESDRRRVNRRSTRAV